jgi:methyl-accepting chemotaxis protein
VNEFHQQRRRIHGHEIQNMINELQTSATKAEQAMESGRQLSAVCQDKAKSTGLVLEKIDAMLQEIAAAGSQIAQAVHQQAGVTEELSHNVFPNSDNKCDSHGLA